MTPVFPESLQRQLLPLEPLPFLHEDLRQAAVLVLLHGDCTDHRADRLQVLLTRRSSQLRHHAGQVAFPGGVLEGQDGSPMHAALRETREEVGLSLDAARIVGRLQSRVTLSGFEVHPFVAWSPQIPVCTLQPDEVSAVFHVPLLTLREAGLQPVEGLWQGQRRQSVGFAPPWQDVWGVTARILNELIQRLLGPMPAR